MIEQAKFAYSALGKAFKNKQNYLKARRKTSLSFTNLKILRKKKEIKNKVKIRK